VDAGNNRVGVGAAPTSTFTITTSTNNDNTLHLQNTTGSSNGGATNVMRVTAGTNAYWGNLDIHAHQFAFRSGAGITSFVANGSGIVFNEESGDRDFRVESDGVSNMLLVDGGNDSVAINRSYGIAPLHVSGSANDSIVPSNAYTKITAQGLDGLAFGSLSSSPYASWIQSGYTDNTYSPSWNNGYPILLNPAGGNVGIRDTAPQVDLHVGGGGHIRSDVIGGKIGWGSGGGSNWYSYITSSNDGSQNVGLEFFTTTNAGVGNTNHLHMHPDNGNIFNEQGIPFVDFRVESDNNANMLFVNAGSDCVNVGSTTPTDTVFNIGTGKTFTGNYAGTIVDTLTADFSGIPNSLSSFIRIGSGRYANYGGTDTGIIFQPSGSNNGYYPRVLQTCHRGNNSTSEGRMRWYRLKQDSSTEIGLYEMNSAGFLPLLDNTYDLGASGNRFDDVYATNGTINTSDALLKEQVTDLSAAELQAATACKALIKKYKWISSVQEKGDDARWHIGVIAQDVQQAFTDAGLDAEDYGLFIRERWWTFIYNGREESTIKVEEIHVPIEEATEHTRLGVRYNELLAFIIAAL